MIKRFLLLAFVLTESVLIADQNTSETVTWDQQNQQYEQLHKALHPAGVSSKETQDAVQRWTRVVPYGLAALGAGDLVTKLAENPSTLREPRELIRPGVLIGSGIVVAIIRAMMLRHWKLSDAKKYSNRLKQILKKWPEQREQVPLALRGVFDQFYVDKKGNESFSVRPFQAQALGRAVAPALSVVDGVNQVVSSEVVMPDDEHTNVVDTPEQRIARYKELYKASEPQEKASKKTYNVVSGLSALIPIGLGAAGVATGWQAYKNKTTFLPALGLMAGAGITTLLRSWLLRHWLQSGMKNYHVSLESFLKSWPEKREHAPRALRATIDALYEQITTHAQGMKSLSVSQAQALHSSMKTLAVIDAAAHIPLSREYEKWQFVLESVGLMEKPHGFWRKLFGRMPEWLRQELFALPTSIIAAMYLSMRVPAFRAYIRGYTGSQMFEDEDFSPTDEQRTAAENSVVAKLLGWPDSYYNSEEDRLARLGGVLLLTGMTLPILYSVIKSGFAAHAAKQEHARKLDHFVSVWPVVKHAVPQVLRDRFEKLYTHSFDEKRGVLTISRKERQEFIERLRTEALPWRALIKARGKKSTKGQNYLKRKRQGNLKRLLGKNKKKKPVTTQTTKTKKDLFVW